MNRKYFHHRVTESTEKSSFHVRFRTWGKINLCVLCGSVVKFIILSFLIIGIIPVFILFP